MSDGTNCIILCLCSKAVFSHCLPLCLFLSIRDPGILKHYWTNSKYWVQRWAWFSPIKYSFSWYVKSIGWMWKYSWLFYQVQTKLWLLGDWSWGYAWYIWNSWSGRAYILSQSKYKVLYGMKLICYSAIVHLYCISDKTWCMFIELAVV